jgi:very-short-patch-repair endonuclease
MTKRLKIEEAEKRCPDMVKGQSWKGAEAKYRFICEKHGEHFQKFSHHQRGHSCRKCGKEFCIDWGKNLSRSIKEVEAGFPEMVRGQTWKGSRAKYWFKCEKCPRKYFQLYGNHQQGLRCPHHKESKMEKATAQILESLALLFERQKRFETCRNSNTLPFDFAIKGEKILIECQGRQHFHPVPQFGGIKAFKQTEVHDAIKRDWAKANGYELITIRYDENVEEVLTARFAAPLRKAA